MIAALLFVVCVLGPVALGFAWGWHACRSRAVKAAHEASQAELARMREAAEEFGRMCYAQGRVEGRVEMAQRAVHVWARSN